MQRTLKAITVCSLFLSFIPGAYAQEATETPAVAAAATEEVAKPSLTPKYRMETSAGDIVLELNAEKAPITVDNFDQYVQDGYYEGTIFHRVIPNFMIQGGGFTADLTEKKDGLRPPIRNEWKNGLKNTRGTIAMARTQVADSATAQFFINVVDNQGLDQPQPDAAYAVFGKVVEGMDVVDKIKDTETVNNARLPMGKVVPKDTVTITKVETLVPLDRGKVQEAVKAAADKAAAAEKAEADKVKNALAKIVAEQEAKYEKKAELHESGLASIVYQEGTGEQPKKTDRVSVHYTGTLPDGKKFDSSVDRGEPFEFSLTGGVIDGWLEGVSYMKVGEKRLLIIPSEMGYGRRGSPPVIPPNATLLFEVELLAIR